jgi:ceramide glucosyltransferase
MNVAPIDAVVALVYAAWLGIAAVACASVFACQRDPPRVFTGYDPATAVIIPVRDVPPQFAAFWQAICAQTYHPFRIIFAVESVVDPAHAALCTLTGGPPIEIVIAGKTARRGQKVHNLLAALARLQASDAVVLFADADIVPQPDWVKLLVRALCDPMIEVVSGCPWMVPSDQRWSSAFVCNANASVATLIRLRPFSFAWGGSSAMRRETFEALDLRRWWDRAVVDDTTLTQAQRARGGSIYSPRAVLVPTPVSLNWTQAIAFGRRQYLLLRLHSLRTWLLAATLTTLPVIGWATAVPRALYGNLAAIIVLVAANFLDHLRAYLRRRVPLKLGLPAMPPRMAWLDRWATPAWLAVHCIILWSTLFGRTINWAGRCYRVDARQQVLSVVEYGVRA